MNRLRTIALTAACILAAGCGENRYSWESDLHHRLELDFCKTRDEVAAYIRKYVPDVTGEEIDRLTACGRLESMPLDGELRYFRNTAPNLFRTDAVYKAIKDSISGQEPLHYYELGEKAIGLAAEEVRKRLKETAALTPADSSSRAAGYPSGNNFLSQPRRVRVRYTLTLKPDAVPDGETVRCWLPYPRTDVPRQRDVKFISAGWVSRPDGSTSPQYFRTGLQDAQEITFSGDGCAHSTLYMEAPASAGWPLKFYEEFEYTACAEWIPLGIVPEDSPSVSVNADGSRAPVEFLKERDRHVIFTPEITRLRDSLTRKEDSPVIKAKAFYDWIDANFPWASAREYSTLENIPEYVMKSRHGDCGQVSLLFITLCRSAGIPARFQSGFMMHPGDEGLHDWAEIWLDGYGWIPVDQSFGGEKYLGAIDQYRLIINNDFGRALVPKKKYPRSETVDFQRGEVEWKRGNLYFDKWDWDLDVTEAEL